MMTDTITRLNIFFTVDTDQLIAIQDGTKHIVQALTLTDRIVAGQKFGYSIDVMNTFMRGNTDLESVRALAKRRKLIQG
jgi:hypothetical protein